MNASCGGASPGRLGAESSDVPLDSSGQARFKSDMEADRSVEEGYQFLALWKQVEAGAPGSRGAAGLSSS